MVSLVCDILSVLVCHPIPQGQTGCTLFKSFLQYQLYCMSRKNYPERM